MKCWFENPFKFQSLMKMERDEEMVLCANHFIICLEKKQATLVLVRTQQKSFFAEMSASHFQEARPQFRTFLVMHFFFVRIHFHFPSSLLAGNAAFCWLHLKLSFKVPKLTISFVSSLELPRPIPGLGLFWQSSTKQQEIK